MRENNGMKKKVKPEVWRAKVKRTKLRVMSSTIQELDDLIRNKKSVPADIAKLIMQDPVFSAKVIKVANSVANNRRMRSETNTLVQSVVRLGVNNIRAICISVCLMDAFITKEKMSGDLKKAIKLSFLSAVQSRRMSEVLGGKDIEVYIAGMLQNLGEVLFWCSDVPKSEEFIKLMNSGFDGEGAFKELSDYSFDDMTEELADEWQLSRLLKESYGTSLSNDTKAVHLGRKIARAVTTGTIEELKKINERELSGLGFGLVDGMQYIKVGNLETDQLVSSYMTKIKKSKSLAA